MISQEKEEFIIEMLTNHLELMFGIFPLRTGLINVSGIRIVDLKKRRKILF